MSLLTAIRDHLISQAVVDSDAWKAYIGWTPDTQDQVISLTPAGGFPQDTHEGENALGSFQVRVRAGKLDYAVGESKWWDVFDALQGADLSASPDFIFMIAAENSEPIYYVDEKQRSCFTLNCRTVRAKP